MHIDRDGARISYTVEGSGPPILLGHSLLCDGSMWREVAPALAGRYLLITIDARGHGASTAERPFTLDDLADDWLAILDREGIDRAALVGLSMGGMTAMRVALRAPARVAALALLDTSADREPLKPRLRNRLLAEVVRRVGFPHVAVPIALRALLGETTLRERPELVRSLRAQLLSLDRRVYHAARAVFDRPPIADRIAAIRCPTLVLVGEEDVATSPSRSRRIAERIPGARLVTVPRVGHLTALEAPAAVVSALEELLAPLAADHTWWR